MEFPTLSPIPRSRVTLDTFGGYNHNLRIGDREFYDMENLSSHRYPVLSTRQPRGIHARDRYLQGMIARDSLCWVEDSRFVMNGYALDMGLSDAGPKQLVSMGAYVIILPDKKYVNTADLSDWGSIDAAFTAAAGVSFSPCKMDGTVYTPDYLQPDPPEDADNMALWVDTSAQPHSLKQYSKSMGIWTGVETTYIKISTPGIGRAFCQYDGVTLSGLKEGNHQQLQALEGTATLYDCQENSITVAGMLDTAVTLEIPLTISRKMPVVDFLVENDNRLWGCRYGLNNQGQVVNELYACKLGDFRNWNCFMGISTDSYYVSLGSDGSFTGAITLGGHPLFFKENCVHKVYGQIPANFSIQTTPCRGVQKGCERSMAIVNEILYYKSQQGICAYDGALPVEVSAALGEGRYCSAVGAALGNKYYVSMEHADSRSRSLFVYDTVRGLWHKEQDPGTKLLCPCRQELYCATEDGKVLTLLGSGEAYEKDLTWMLETGILGGSLPEKKSLCRLDIRIFLEPGSRVDIRAQYDSVGDWSHLGTITGLRLGSFTIPVKPRRCDHLRLRLEGEGTAVIHSITKTYHTCREGM